METSVQAMAPWLKVQEWFHIGGRGWVATVTEPKGLFLEPGMHVFLDRDLYECVGVERFCVDHLRERSINHDTPAGILVKSKRKDWKPPPPVHSD